jgi:hypothetical protein
MDPNRLFALATFQSSDAFMNYATTQALGEVYLLRNPLDKLFVVHYYACQWNKGIGTKGNEAVRTIAQRK